MRYFALLLIAANVAIFAVQSLVGGFTDMFVLHDVANNPWTLLTAMFLHGSAWHLLTNMFALFLFGLILESKLGSRKFLALYFSSGIVAGIAGSFLYPSLLGASGAIFGIIGFLAVVQPKMVVWTYGVPMPMAVAALFWFILDLLGVFYPSDVANLSHIAGVALGVALGLYSIRNKPRTKRSRNIRLVSDEEFRRWEDSWM